MQTQVCVEIECQYQIGIVDSGIHVSISWKLKNQQFIINLGGVHNLLVHCNNRSHNLKKYINL